MLRTAAVVFVVLVVAAALAHGYAWAQWRASFGRGGYEQRLAEARRASAVEPWNAELRARPDWVRGDEYSRRNQPGNAYYYLHRAADVYNGDPRLRKRLREAYDAWYLATTWKAHVQHAREQTGGVLLEKDHIP
ncbi:MAG TPA: hypothetical protein VGK50_01815 [Coriobacteriia bacterium]|jgi:hypothetical protein